MSSDNCKTNFRKVNVLRGEWDLPDYYENVIFTHRSAFGIFCNAVDKRNKTNVEIKRWSLNTKEITRKAYAELKMLKHIHHKNIISHLNSFFLPHTADPTKLYIVTNASMNDNLNNIIRAQRLQSDDIRYVIFQIVSALDYLHTTCGIVHRDLKPLDIGINKDMSIKIIDLNAEQPKETDYVLTKWYRAPELLFAWKPSTEKVDLWSLGCILGEFLSGRIMFAGRDHLQQLRLILELLGTPPKDFFNPSCHFCILTQNLMTGEKFVRSLPFFRKRSLRKTFDECDDEDTLDFLEQLLTLEPSDRIDTKQALKHPYFKKYHPKNETSDENSTDTAPPRKFDDETDESEDWIELIRQSVEISD